MEGRSVENALLTSRDWSKAAEEKNALVLCILTFQRLVRPIIVSQQ